MSARSLVSATISPTSEAGEPPRSDRVRRRWRPPLALFVAVAVFLLIALPTLGMATVVVVSRTPDILLNSIREHFWTIVLVESLVVAAGVTVGYAFWRGLTDPLGRLVERAERVAAGHREFDATGPFGTREVARLGESFAATVRELQRRSRYIETFSTHLAHELKSPLTSIRGAAELLREEGEDMTDAQRRRFLDNIVDDADRMTALVTRLRDLARADVEQGVGEADVASVVGSMSGDYPRLSFSLDLPEGYVLPLAEESVAIVLHHLFDNAARNGAGHVSLTTEGRRLVIENDGDPIPEGDRERVLTPFFTTRREDGGTGLGLAIVSTMLGVAGGTVEIAGTSPVRFAITFE